MRPVSIRARPRGRAIAKSPALARFQASGFNPRPASRPGDWDGGGWRTLTATVSIRARPRGRAIGIPAVHGRCAASFQSAPGLEAGRLGSLGNRPRRLTQFQSAPGLEAGRLSPHPLPAPVEHLFQSAPGLEAGRLGGRARGASRWACFNPRPASRPGDCADSQAPSTNRPVSIRARPRGRAILRQHSPPAPAPSFNPRPASRPGDYPSRACQTYGLHRFNPRPASRPGD